MNSTLNARGMFRQHATIDPAPARHWLLENSSGRDFLTIAARKYVPDARISLSLRRAEDEPVLDQMIGLLGMRAMAEPEDALQQARLSWHFAWEMVKLQFGCSVYQPVTNKNGGSRG